MRGRKDKRSEAFRSIIIFAVSESELDAREKAPLGDRRESMTSQGAVSECRSIANEIAYHELFQLIW
jgi:hypothetical protein